MRISRSGLRVPKNRKITEILELAELGKKSRVVFHDLSNHLTALTLSVGHLEENLVRDTKRLHEYSKRSEKTRIQMEYVATLLRSHIENASETIFCLNDEIRKIIETFAEKATMRKIGIIFESEENIKIFGSKNAFFHVVTNLISNSLDSFDFVTDKRAREIGITARKNHSNIQISVSDTGCGIKNADIGKIFNYKYTTKLNGHGIGLFAAKEYIEQELGGTIKVKSSNDGTLFLIKIPKTFESGKQNRKRQAFPVLLDKNETRLLGRSLERLGN